MPRVIEHVDLDFRKPGDGKIDQQLVQDHPMEDIQRGPRQLAGSNTVHAGAVPGTPCVGELCGVHSQPFPFRQRVYLLRD